MRGIGAVATAARPDMTPILRPRGLVLIRGRFGLFGRPDVRNMTPVARNDRRDARQAVTDPNRAGRPSAKHGGHIRTGGSNPSESKGAYAERTHSETTT